MAAKDRSTQPRHDQPIYEAEIDAMRSRQLREGLRREKPVASRRDMRDEQWKMEMEKMGGGMPHGH